MPKSPSPFLLAGLSIACLAGCEPAPRPVPRVPVPQSFQSGGPVKTYEPLRPLQSPAAVAAAQPEMSDVPPPAFEDAPLVHQTPPEQAMYVEAYGRIGQPRVAVFVNRTIEGNIVPVDERAAVVRGPAQPGDRPENYLAPGQYDEAQAKSIDYEAIEVVLADTLAANGKVTLVSPTMARQRLSDDEVKELQAGRPQALREVAEKLDADVLVQVQARPTKQTSEGLGVRILVEAINTRGGESIARSFVDVPAPLNEPKINDYARFLARRTMYELANTWTAMASAPPRNNAASPTTQPR